MAAQVLVGATLCSMAAVVLWWAAASGRSTERARRSLRSLDDIDGGTYRQLSLAPSARQRIGVPVLDGIVRRVHRFTPSGTARAMQRRIDRAGVQDRWTIERLIAAKLLLALAGFLLILLWALSAGSGFWTIASFAIGVAAYLTPDGVLDHIAEDRQARLQDDMPDVIDQLTITVQAGLGFDAAVDRIARSGRGPFAEELGRVVQDIRLGQSRANALRALAARTSVPEVDQFVTAMNHADVYGLSVSSVLRVQADELRDKRRQRAEERARKIPVKMVLPLIFCVFPTIFIAALGPVVIRAINFDYGFSF